MSETKQPIVNLADEDQVKEVLAGAVLGLWDVVNSLTRLRPSKRERYHVTIFGSAHVKRAPQRAKSIGIRVDPPSTRSCS